jgi:hypothetical protein
MILMTSKMDVMKHVTCKKQTGYTQNYNNRFQEWFACNIGYLMIYRAELDERKMVVLL